MSTNPPSAPVIKKEVPPPEVSLSPFASLSAQEQFIHFKEYTQQFYDSLRAQDFSQAENFNDAPLKAQVHEIAAEFDKHSLLDLLTSPSQVINDLGQFITNHVDPSAYKFIATSWPPVVPSSQNDFVTFFLVELLHVAEHPTNILAWLARKVFPEKFTTPKPTLKAICRCKKDGKKPGFWAVLDTQNNFKLYTFKKNDVVVDYQGKINDVTIGSDKLTVEIKAANKVVAKFVPEDPAQVTLWGTAFKSPAPLIKSFTSFKTPAVDEIYKVAYQQVVNADAFIVKAAISSNIVKPDSAEAKNVIEAFYTAFAYARKVPVLISTVLMNDFQEITKDINAVISENNYTKQLFKKIITKNEGPYAKGFLTNLIKYIDQTGGYGIGTDNVDVAGVEKLITNIVKFIALSFNQIPAQVKAALSIARAYISLRTNSKTIIYNAVAQYFLKDYIVPRIEKAKTLVPDIKNPNIFTPISRLLYVIFSLGEMSGEFEKLQPLEKRLEHHTYKLILEFAVQISVIPTSVVEFPVPTGDNLARALETIMTAMTANVTKFQEIYDAAENAKGQSLIGSNYASLLTTEFIHEYDAQNPANEVEAPPPSPKKHKIKLVKADNFEDLEGKVVHKVVPIDKSVETEVDTTKKYYKKVTKRVPRNKSPE